MIRSLAYVLSCSIVAACVPSPLIAADPGVAMLYAKGVVEVNGNAVNESTAVFPGSIIETKPDSLANLNISGSTIIFQPETLVKFEGTDVYLDHGSVNLASSTKIRVLVKCVRVNPVSDAWTQFEVSDINGTLQVVASKASVGIAYGTEFALPKVASPGSIDSGKPAVVLAEGQQWNRFERDGCPVDDKEKAVTAASKAIQDTPAFRYTLAGGGAGILIWILTRGGSPISPTNP